MKSFEDLKTNWQDQKFDKKPELDISRLDSRLSKLKRDQLFTPIILGVTIIILLSFLFLQPKANFQLLRSGLLLMSVSLFIRIIFEVWSILEIKKLDITLEVSKFTENLNKFKKSRKIIHFIVTPIVLIIYILAFVSLLPIFKLNVSAGMYQYILWSSAIVFIVIILIKIITIPKELRMLKDLQEDF